VSSFNQDNGAKEGGEKKMPILPSFEPSLEIFRKHIGRCLAAEQRLLQEKEE
jgi:hypothetical protein